MPLSFYDGGTKQDNTPQWPLAAQVKLLTTTQHEVLKPAEKTTYTTNY